MTYTAAFSLHGFCLPRTGWLHAPAVLGVNDSLKRSWGVQRSTGVWSDFPADLIAPQCLKAAIPASVYSSKTQPDDRKVSKHLFLSSHRLRCRSVIFNARRSSCTVLVRGSPKVTSEPTSSAKQHRAPLLQPRQRLSAVVLCCSFQITSYTSFDLGWRRSELLVHWCDPSSSKELQRGFKRKANIKNQPTGGEVEGKIFYF